MHTHQQPCVPLGHTARRGRDEKMAHTLYDKRTPGASTVLGVMGAAHVNGVYNRIRQRYEHEERRQKRQGRRW